MQDKDRTGVLLLQNQTRSVLILLTSCQPNMYDIYHCCVYSEKTPYDGQRNCPKHVEFYSKIKFEKLVHLVGFIIRLKANQYHYRPGVGQRVPRS